VQLLHQPPASDTWPADRYRGSMGPYSGPGPTGLSIAQAAAAIFGTDRPTVSQKSSVHRAATRLVEQGEAIYLGSTYTKHGGHGRWIGRPRTPDEQAAYEAEQERRSRRADAILGSARPID
jgi:hypothetical protein